MATNCAVTDEVRKVFKSFDSNGDAKISVNELGNVLTALDPSNLDWATIILAYCLSTAIGMALVPIQLHSKQLPLSFCFLGLAITLSFSSILVSKFIQESKCPRIIVHIFHYFGVFFGVIAFFISITIPFPLWFKCTASVIYAASGLVILFCHHYYN